MFAKKPVWLLLGLQFLVAAASLVVEIVAGRMLAPYVGMSLYTWTSVIAVVLAGFSAGHWWGGRIAAAQDETALWRTGWTMIGAALSTGIAVSLLHGIAGSVLTPGTHPVWGIAVLSLAVFFLPSLFAGVPAPVLARISVDTTGRPGQALGAMFAASAVGAIAGTLLAGFLFISWLGTAITLACVTLTYAVVALALFAMSGRGLLGPLVSVAAAIALAGLAYGAPNPCTVESRYFCIRVIDRSDPATGPARLMVIDHLGHGMSARDHPRTMYTEHAAMLDALARIRAPRSDFSSFFIGGGSYSIPRAFADRGTGARVVAEIDPEVTRIAARDFWFDPASATIYHEDARRALQTRPGDRFDVILGDAFTDVAVPAHLVTEEFYRLVATRLADDGTFLMNVIDYADRLQALASVVRTMQQVFDQVEVWTNTVPPDPGGRVVFVIAAGSSATPVDRFRTLAPEPVEFGAMADGWVNRLAEQRGIILSDDFAPIDRLIGRPD